MNLDHLRQNKRNGLPNVAIEKSINSEKISENIAAWKGVLALLIIVGGVVVAYTYLPSWGVMTKRAEFPERAIVS